MKILLAGASGAIGVPLTHRLAAAGHEVLGLTREGGNVATIVAAGGRPVVADALDRDALLRALDGLSADAVVHELTGLKKPPTHHRGMALTDRLRTEGTANLVAAADVLGATRFVSQSIVFGYGFTDHGERVLDESAPFGELAGDASDPHIAAMRAVEDQTFATGHGIALRYGLFYGGDAAAKVPALRGRGIPVADGGVLPWVHHDDAAAATVAAIERGRPGRAYDIVDDRPATWREVFTAMAAALGAPAPRHLPRWMFRLVAPYVASFAIDTSMRVANDRARDELGWRPVYRDFEAGVRAMAAAVAAGSGPDRIRWAPAPATSTSVAASSPASGSIPRT
jgi:nucleoside-diphosphate-sugar epimerase